MIKYVKIPKDSDPLFTEIGAYEVHYKGELIGYVWKVEEHSYKGSQGMNRGYRITDYHPIRWSSSIELGGVYCRGIRMANKHHDKRNDAAERLVIDGKFESQKDIIMGKVILFKTKKTR